jgi:16S rRNA (cytosine1402-N4)-methyltransferase
MQTADFVHKPVLFDEVLESLRIKPDGIYVDGTTGGAGHSSGIAEKLVNGRLISFDRDADAIAVATERLARFGERSTIVHSNFSEIKSVLLSMGVERIDGLLLDLGVSSYQLDCAERGFSYMADAPLDMRMDKRDSVSAYDVVNGYSAAELKKILWEYGEEKFAPSIANAIVRARETKPIESTLELSDIIKGAMPASARNGAHHPAKRSFQAIRICVNGELSIIENTIRDAVSMMNNGGIISIITFHSLEDRIVKQTFADLAKGCTCPKSFPVCICGNKPSLEIVSRKPILPSDDELEVNPRSRSAKLRVAMRINQN